MSKKMELPLSGASNFYNQVVNPSNTTARMQFGDGLWMVHSEGLARVADAATGLELADFGHFRLHYSYDLVEPMAVGHDPEVDPSRGDVAVVSAITGNVLDKRHTLVLSQESECSEIKVDRSGVDPLYSPFKRAVYIGDTLRVGLDLSRAGSDQGVLMFQGCDGISFKGVSRRAFSNEDAWEVSESPGESSAFFVSLQEGSTFGSVTYYPID